MPFLRFLRLCLVKYLAGHWMLASCRAMWWAILVPMAFGVYARQAEFQGPVKAGCEYVLVDDFVGMGGTLANMKGYIESNGGRVLAAACLTGKSHSAKLVVSPERLLELRTQHGTELENWWIGHFAHTFDALTESEARYLTRTETADAIRDRIAAAEQAGDGETLSGKLCTPSSQRLIATDNNEVSGLSAIGCAYLGSFSPSPPWTRGSPPTHTPRPHTCTPLVGPFFKEMHHARQLLGLAM